MSTLLPEKEKFPRKIINFYRKVFPSTDEKYWYTYKSKINTEIKNLSISDLRWEVIKGRAELESKFAFIWSSVGFGIVCAAVFAFGLDIATKIIEFGEYFDLYILSTVYVDFMLMVVFFTLFVSFGGWLFAMFMNIPGKKAGLFYGIFFVMLIVFILSFYWKHTIIIDFVFLVLNTFCMTMLLGTVADLKKQRALIRLALMEDRLHDLEKR